MRLGGNGLGVEAGGQGSVGPAGPQGPAGPAGPTGPMGPSGADMDYGVFLDQLDQVAESINTAYPVKLRTTDISSGISVASDSRITVTHTGIYNFQFSLQLNNTGGAGSGKEVYIWLRKNGSDVATSNTSVSVRSDVKYVVAAWNFVVSLNAGQYIELMWATENTAIIIDYLAATGIYPAIPSVIGTMTQIR